MKTHTMHAVMIALLGLAVVTPQPVRAHCQVPCGIYDDDARFTLLLEHITTIEKSMKRIKDLESQDHAHANQLVRWVSNKDSHADAFTEIVTYYFMAQRVKPAPVNPATRLVCLGNRFHNCDPKFWERPRWKCCTSWWYTA